MAHYVRDLIICTEYWRGFIKVKCCLVQHSIVNCVLLECIVVYARDAVLQFCVSWDVKIKLEKSQQSQFPSLTSFSFSFMNLSS